MKFNQVTVFGTLGDEPMIRKTSSGKTAATLSIAVDDPYTDSTGNKKDRTYWFRIVAWSYLADFAQQNMHKGSQALFSGKLTSRSYNDKEGKPRTIVEIVADDIQLLPRKGADSSNWQPTNSANAPQTQNSSAPLNTPPAAAQTYGAYKNSAPAQEVNAAAQNPQPAAENFQESQPNGIADDGIPF
ncbi:MAG TPA: single-stranded DNA-binding protein [Succinivibrionaceae bacterium]|nr:single-stranded DNA-binding protein [Succinivibrionaceae bacterium]